MVYDKQNKKDNCHSGEPSKESQIASNCGHKRIMRVNAKNKKLQHMGTVNL